MQTWPTESSDISRPNDAQEHLTPNQDGSQHQQRPLRPAHLPQHSVGSSSASPHSIADGLDGVNAGQLDERLRLLSIRNGHPDGRHYVAGQRITDYENALAPSNPRQALGFKVIKRVDSLSDGVQLTDFPNEILTHVLSHLHPDSHAAVALVSKRFYSLVTTPHAWRMAFLRYFPGHESLADKPEKEATGPWEQATTEFVRSEARYFARLTSLATWRSEYLLRTRLLRGLVRGKPGASGGIGTSARSTKKISAVLTYNSKLPWAVTSLHAIFSNGKKPPRAVHGAADLGFATMSDPTSGKVEKWGFDEPFSSQQLDEVFPDLEPYGVGEGPAAGPNVMDVSVPYGLLAGEGHPGVRAYYRPIHEKRGRYLTHESGVVDTYPDIPRIPELSEAISSLWIAKSSAVPYMTLSMVGILTGSTLGVVTAYALGGDNTGHRFSNGDMTARWVLSPGVPIISIKVDDQYNQRRKNTRRVWAVALNALGEVFFLTEPPTSSLDRAKGEDVTKNAWLAGRSVYWQLVEQTRRRARPDDSDKNAIRGAYTPRSPADSMELSKEQLAAEAREIEKFLRHKPSHFRKVCEGWDMKRVLEVDFAHDDGNGGGEAIIVIECGWEKGQGPKVSRYMRSLLPKTPQQTRISELKDAGMETQPEQVPASIFGAKGATANRAEREPVVPASVAAPLQTPTGTVTPAPNLLSDWSVTVFGLAGYHKSEITASAIDVSLHAAVTSAEDPLRETVKGTSHAGTPISVTPRTAETLAEIPGRSARMLAIGTKSGVVLLWNMRETGPLVKDMKPVRIIQTESPEISCLALNGLYLVHGGSDGLVQAWDPLASSLDPLRTLNARPSGRVPRHMLTMNPALANENYTAARTIFLDPDPTVLRGVTAFGAFLRYWSYSATSQPPGRKRRLRHADIHGRLATRRQGGKVSGYIAAETAELRLEQEHRSREQARLRNRFGVGALGDLTEEEAVRYAQMISEESFHTDEQRRTSASDTGDASFDTASSFSESTASTVTPDPSVNGLPANGFSPPPTVDEESEYEMQVQQALRLSLLEGVNDHGHSPRGKNSNDYEVPITIKSKSAKKGKRSASRSPPASYTAHSGANGGSSSQAPMTQEEEDLALALKLSMEDQGTHGGPVDANAIYEQQEDFPSLEVKGKGKGKM
ncbi:DNA-directed RNA polymerase II subunit rpb1 [Verticillium dahliae VDG1]|nr:DNA-directed RNA polymerase II subunit rpb1 [Verticillium dahliae VDG1]